MSNKFLWAGLVTLVLFLGYAVWSLSRPVPAVRPLVQSSSSVNKQALPAVSWPSGGGQAIGLAGYGVLATHGTTTPLPTASVAKVMLALAVLQKKPLASGQVGPSIPITSDDVAAYQQGLATHQSVLPMQTGQDLTEYQALQALLLASANNVATKLAVWAFGSEQAYLDAAKSSAAQLHMTGSIFSDASGLSPKTVSTPNDLIVLGQAALQQPIIAQIVKQKSAPIPVAGIIYNYNADLGNSAGINGIKTGNTDEAGGCFLFSTDYHGTPLIGAVMGAPDLNAALQQATNIASSFSKSLQQHTVIHSGQAVATYEVPWQGTIKAVAQKDVAVTDIAGSSYALHANLKPLSDKTTAQVGELNFTYRGKIYSSPVILEKPWQAPSIWWRFTHPTKR